MNGWKKLFAPPAAKFLVAADKGDFRVVKALLKRNPGLVLSKDLCGMTPLHLAVQRGHKDMVELLLANGANVNAKDNGGKEPLYWSRRTEVNELLLANKAEHTIHDLARIGDLARLKTMLKSNPDAVFSRDPDKDGYTPLHWAAQNCPKEVAELLLANKAEVNAKDDRGCTPLHVAAVSGRKDVVKLLLDNTAEVNAKDCDGKTPLHHAALYSSCEMAELLLIYKAEVNSQNNTGLTPLGIAWKEAHPFIDPPLNWAAPGCSKDMVKLLRHHGGHE